MSHVPEQPTTLTPWQHVQLARHPARPHTLDYVEHMTEEFVPLHGDRLTGDDKAVVGGLGKMDGETFMIIGHQKGRSIQERQERNFGMAHPAGYRKALRLMRLAEKFNKPILTLIDTPGAYPGPTAEAQGQASAIAHNIQAMFSLCVPIIAVVIGEGGSGGALGMAVADRVMMLEHAWYTVIAPESCATILWKSQAYKEQAAAALKLTAEEMLGNGLIDGVISEPQGGAHQDMLGTINTVKKTVLAQLTILRTMSPQALVEERIAKFSEMRGRLQ